MSQTGYRKLERLLSMISKNDYNFSSDYYYGPIYGTNNAQTELNCNISLAPLPVIMKLKFFDTDLSSKLITTVRKKKF